MPKIIAKKSSFIKKCPCTPKYASCNYYVLNLGIGCTFNCTYCFLHHYMNSPFVIYSNTDKIADEVKELCARHPQKTIRLGSGEFVDSLGFDALTGLNKSLIPQISKIKNLLFEVKTKSADVAPLLDLEHNGRVVVSFSVNTPKIIESEEALASKLNERIEAAAKCQAAGYKIGFHFDPLIYHDGWREGYRQVVDDIFKVIEPKNIAWISLGALRFNASLKPIIQKKFPASNIVYAEMVPGLDAKLRYFIAIRKELFKALTSYIRAYSPQVWVYLCMESKELAKEVGLT